MATILDQYSFYNQGQRSRVFVTNLKHAFRNPEHSLSILRRIMEQVGIVRTIKLKHEITTNSFCAIVQFCTTQAAQRAVRSLQDTPFNNRRLKIRLDRKKDPPNFNKILWNGHVLAQANDLFKCNGWSSEIVAIKTNQQDGSCTVKIALHIYASEYVVVESPTPERLTILSSYTTHRKMNNEQGYVLWNSSLSKISNSEARSKAFQTLKVVRIQTAGSKIKLLVFPEKEIQANSSVTSRFESEEQEEVNENENIERQEGENENEEADNEEYTNDNGWSWSSTK